jgi:hypothetical protein
MRRHTCFLIAVLLFAVSARAQVAVYVTSSSGHFSNVPTGVIGTGNQEQYTSYWASGIGGGVTLNFLPIGPVKLGFDFRGSTRPGTTGADTAMGGIRLGINPPLIRIKPYVQASAGYVATRTVNVSSGLVGQTFTNKCPAWEILGGIDYPLMRFLDLRVIEVGGGQAYPLLSSSNSNISMFTINTGVVFHF